MRVTIQYRQNCMRFKKVSAPQKLLDVVRQSDREQNLNPQGAPAVFELEVEGEESYHTPTWV